MYVSPSIIVCFSFVCVFTEFTDSFGHFFHDWMDWSHLLEKTNHFRKWIIFRFSSTNLTPLLRVRVSCFHILISLGLLATSDLGRCYYRVYCRHNTFGLFQVLRKTRYSDSNHSSTRSQNVRSIKSTDCRIHSCRETLWSRWKTLGQKAEIQSIATAWVPTVNAIHVVELQMKWEHQSLWRLKPKPSFHDWIRFFGRCWRW